jgi:hypothetical protein
VTAPGRSETFGPLSGTAATREIAVDGVEIRLAGRLNGSFGQDPLPTLSVTLTSHQEQGRETVPR